MVVAGTLVSIELVATEGGGGMLWIVSAVPMVACLTTHSKQPHSLTNSLVFLTLNT